VSRETAVALPWRRGIAWLLFLGPFFFLSYGFANWWAGSGYATPGALVFSWERQIPFIPWTIVPYWSIDLFYGLSFLLCRNRQEVDRHAYRLLTAQVIAIACFVAMPLRFSFERPVADGAFGALFTALAGFDKPFNQAPSLHIALLVILWVRFAAASTGLARQAVHLWAALIGISVLTTYQHHFIDIPTGALLGLFCLWLWPDGAPTPISTWRWTCSIARRRLGLYYLAGAALCIALAIPGGALLWLLWPAIALLFVALIYLGLGAPGFQKSAGRLSIASRWLMAPYTAGAWLNSRLWTRHDHHAVEVADGVWLGRLPTGDEMRAGGFNALLDLTAELPAPQGVWHYENLPWLDLVAPDADQLRHAAARIEWLRQRGSVRVCCALGYGRAVGAVAAWLLVSGRAVNLDQALEVIGGRRRVALGADQRAALAELSIHSARAV